MQKNTKKKAVFKMTNEMTTSQAELLINANVAIYFAEGQKKEDAIFKIKELARLAVNPNKEFTELVKWALTEIKKHDRKEDF